MTKNISIGLSGSWNSRDVATITGIKPGVLLRSASLSKLSEKGQQKLLELNVTDVIDLRSEREIKNDGIDRLPPSINLHHLPIDAGDVSNFKDVLGKNIAESLKLLMANPQAEEMASEYMVKIYKQAIINPKSTEQLISALKIISSANGGTLVHCTAGKDRTGILVALTLMILNIDIDLIKQDYLYSNNSVETLEAHIGAEGRSKFIRSMLEVHVKYLVSTWDEINKSYKSMDRFLMRNHFTEKDKQILQGKFR